MKLRMRLWNGRHCSDGTIEFREHLRWEWTRWTFGSVRKGTVNRINPPAHTPILYDTPLIVALFRFKKAEVQKGSEDWLQTQAEHLSTKTSCSTTTKRKYECCCFFENPSQKQLSHPQWLPVHFGLSSSTKEGPSKKAFALPEQRLAHRPPSGASNYFFFCLISVLSVKCRRG